MRVLACDNLDSIGIDILRGHPGFTVDVRDDLTPETLLDVIGDYDALIVRSKTKVTSAVIERATRLKVVGRAGTGVDNIDVGAATRRGIVVMNAAAGNTVTTAEHAIALLMALARKIPQASETTKRGVWEKKKFTGTEVSHKTLGIVGVGKIGSVVANRAQGLAMNVLAFDPFLSPEAASRLGVELVSLDELFSRSDFITVHTPMTEETRGIVGEAAFRKMKDGVRIVNCARGGLVDEVALANAIREGKVGGAALDVFEKEPVPADHPLLAFEEVIATPHLGASTEEAQQGVAKIIAEQIVDYLDKGTVRGAVNAPSLTSDQLAELQPYLNLGAKIGQFAGQAFGRGLAAIDLSFSGEIASLDVRPVAQAIVAGILGHALEGVNAVNASVVAEDRGVRVTQSTSLHARDYASTVAVRIKSGDGEHEILGALFGTEDARIVRVDGFALEAVPEGHLILLSNRDVPGVIGKIATLLGDAGVNIGRFYLGRKQAGDVAMAIVQVDEGIDDALLARLAQLSDILSARRIAL